MSTGCSVSPVAGGVALLVPPWPLRLRPLLAAAVLPAFGRCCGEVVVLPHDGGRLTATGWKSGAPFECSKDSTGEAR